MNLTSRQITLVSTFIALAAVVRIGIDEIATVSPPLVFGVLIKVGLTETLTFVSGFLYGPLVGFVTGAAIIGISDVAVLPGAWTPFIAAIIGVLGVLASVIRRFSDRPSVMMLAVSAVGLTLVSEFLQNSWVALFYNVPLLATILTGLPSLLVALVNNGILFTTVGLKTIRHLQEACVQRQETVAVTQLSGAH